MTMAMSTIVMAGAQLIHYDYGRGLETPLWLWEWLGGATMTMGGGWRRHYDYGYSASWAHGGGRRRSVKVVIGLAARHQQVRGAR